MEKYILTSRGELLLSECDGCFRLPVAGEVVLSECCETYRFGEYVAASLASVGNADERMVRRGLRESWGSMSEEEFRAAAKGMELVNWNEAERHCSADGEPLERCSEISKRCPKCGKEYFPRLNPAIVVLVKRGDDALLVHARSLSRPVMALVAGFVETGESLEECVAREVMEETSLEIGNIRYYGSQAWPYPYQLMIGFTAEYKSGELSFADGELTEGGFFSRENPPSIPTMPSLSRKIIDAWLNGEI